MKAPGTLDMLTALASLACLASACASSTVRVGDSSGGAGSGVTGGSGGGSGATSGAGGSGISLTLPPPSVEPDASTTGSSADGEVVACNGDAGGDACACSTLNVAVVGTPGVWGNNDTAFQGWLTSSSTGTAKVANYLTKPSFTPEFLDGYNLIILAGVGDNSNNGPWWTFSASEVAAFQDWIENKGGGVISLSGYSNDSHDVTTRNALLAFSGIAYNSECISPPCSVACNYQCGNPSQITEFNRTDPVIANLSIGVKMIGIDGGYTISAPADAHVAAFTTKTTGVSNWLVGKIVGKGRVLVYADEWITYTSQWDGQNQNSNDPSCTDLWPYKLYQTSQFWYNMLHWAQPGATCFTIIDNAAPTPVTIW